MALFGLIGGSEPKRKRCPAGCVSKRAIDEAVKARLEAAERTREKKEAKERKRTSERRYRAERRAKDKSDRAFDREFKRHPSAFRLASGTKVLVEEPIFNVLGKGKNRR